MDDFPKKSGRPERNFLPAFRLGSRLVMVCPGGSLIPHLGQQSHYDGNESNDHEDAQHPFAHDVQGLEDGIHIVQSGKNLGGASAPPMMPIETFKS